jgi:uncharacterized protein involved in tolerance to divalent cations
MKSLKRSCVVVLVTASTREEAEKIVRRLLDETLIACANIVGPVHSIFCWAGNIETAEEFIVIMKSSSDLFEEVSKKFRRRSKRYTATRSLRSLPFQLSTVLRAT